ncbi:class I glutamine amidotransferase-like protein [Clavulina sp. PMI_390]|nr:class I glutamine amidotransferase-like protein [Clavulina sp. PMI_390]
MSSILFVLSSASKTLTGEPTGWYLPEAAHPYYVLAPSYTITFAAPGGPNPPLDPASIEMFKEDEESVKFLKDPKVQKLLETTVPLKDIKMEDYEAIFWVGGHGPMLDLAFDPINAKLLETAVTEKKVVAAVCHGPGAIVLARINGKAIFADKQVTGFSNVEEEQVKKVKDIPFLLEDRLIELGGRYTKAAEPWGAHVVVDGNLITGQNPASAKGVGEAIKTALEERAKGSQA